MLKLYHEDPEFDEYTSFDTDTGKLLTLSKDEWESLQKLRGQPSSEKSVFDGKTSSLHTRFPRRIYFQITRRCNISCDYCFIKAGKDGEDIPTDQVYKVAEHMGRNGLMEVRLTGGEPTIHRDFRSIVRRFREEGVYVSVATNGIWDNKTRDFLCKEKGVWVICSIDGGKDVHEKYRPGTFDRIIKNLKHLKRFNPDSRIRLTCVLTKENKGNIRELGRVARDVMAESITVIPLRPQVRTPSILGSMVSAADFRSVIIDLIAAKKEFGIPFTTTMETEYKDEIFKDPIVRKRSSCAAGREATNLDYDSGKKEFLVYACSYSPASDLLAHRKLREPFLAGSFRHDEIGAFRDIWEDDSRWKIYRDLTIRSAYCRGCDYLKKHRCTGSCPIQNIDYSSIDVGEDVLEQLKHQIEHTAEWYCYKKIIG